MGKKYTVSSLIRDLNFMLVLGDTSITVEMPDGTTSDSIRVYEDLDDDGKVTVYIEACQR